jgi:hypothetical protein
MLLTVFFTEGCKRNSLSLSLSLYLSLSPSLSFLTERTLMQLWDILFVGWLNMVSARDKLQQNSSSSASGSQADGALPSHDGPLIASFNIIVGTVNIASSFTRFFGASRLCSFGVIARPKGHYLRCCESSYAVELQISFNVEWRRVLSAVRSNTRIWIVLYIAVPKASGSQYAVCE